MLLVPLLTVDYREQMREHGLVRISTAAGKFQQAVECIAGYTDDPLVLTGTIMDERGLAESLADSEDYLGAAGGEPSWKSSSSLGSPRLEEDERAHEGDGYIDSHLEHAGSTLTPTTAAGDSLCGGASGGERRVVV